MMEPMGMLRQSSAPSLVPGGYGGFEPYQRLSKASYDVSRSPGMRRSASASNLNFTRPTAAPSMPQRPSRRRLHEASPHYVSPGDRFRNQAPLRGFPHKDAVHMDTRLTERLREQTFSSVEPTRRRQRAAKAPMAGQGAYGYNSPYGYAYSGYATPAPAIRSAASSPYQGSAYSQFGGVPTELYPQEPASESLKIYSDLFEEVIERDRVFGSLLRKVKAAYDSHLGREAGAVPPMPGVAENLPKALPRGLASEPVLASEASQVDASQPWELHRENQALKDLIERLHMELEVAVKREQRWKNKAAKLKARANASRLSSSTQLMAPAQETPSYWAGAGIHGFPQMDGQWVDAMGAAGARPLHEPRSFHPSRREPALDASQPVQACGPEVLNQGGLFSLSSISPQHSQLQPVEPIDVPGAAASGTETARSDDSGYLPQRQERRVIRPPSVPQLDLDQVQQHIEEDEQEQEEEVMEQETQDGHASGPAYAGDREHHMSRELGPGTEMPMDLGTPRLDPAEEDDLRRIFDACDREGDGTMNKWELIRLCQERPAVADFFGIPQQEGGPRDIVETRFRSLEATADNKVNWDEFLDWYVYELQLIEARAQA